MREIKFRGKRIDNSEWIYGFIWQKLNPHKETNEYLQPVFMQTGVNIDQWHEVDPSTVGQYTGRKDKNGKKIYEGDRVNGGIYNGSYYIGVVEFYKGEFGLSPEGKFAEGWCELTFPELEIIGNIHETNSE